MAVAWSKWHSHSVLLRYRNVTLYLAQCNREFQGHYQVSTFIVSYLDIHLWSCIHYGYAYTNILLDGPQACLCDIIIYRRDFSVSLCRHGCIGYREVEDCRSNLQACSLLFSLRCKVEDLFLIWIFCYVQPCKVCCFELHHFSIGAGFKSCFRFPTILPIKFDQKNSRRKDIF